MARRRPSLQTQLVLDTLLRVWLDDPQATLYGREITDRTGLMPGTTYPILQRMIDDGIVIDSWEDVDPSEVKRPQRRYYRLSRQGASYAQSALDAAREASARALRQLGWQL